MLSLNTSLTCWANVDVAAEFVGRTLLSSHLRVFDIENKSPKAFPRARAG